MHNNRNEIVETNSPGLIQTNNYIQKDSRQWSNKIQCFLVICIYDKDQKMNEMNSIVKKYRDQGNVMSFPVFENVSGSKSFVIWDQAYKENEQLFIELRLASRNELISKISEKVVFYLLSRYEEISSTPHPILQDKRSCAQAIRRIEELLKKDTFLADYSIWDEFCDWFRMYLIEWVLEEIAFSIGFDEMERLTDREINQLFYQYITKNLEDNIEFQTKFTHIVNRYTKEWVKKIIIALRLETCSIDTINKLLNYEEAPLHTKEHLLNLTKDFTFNMAIHDHILVMNNTPYHSVREAIYKKDFQKQLHSPWPTTPIVKGNTEGYLQIRPQSQTRELNDSACIEKVWIQVQTLSDIDVDVFDSLCSIFLSRARKNDEFITISLDDLLTIRGLKHKLGGDGRRGGFDHKQRKNILKSLSIIQNLWLHLDQITVYSNGKPEQTTLQGRIFLFKNDEELENASLTDRSITFSVDPIFSRYLNGKTRQVALLSLQALRYDPYRQNWEKRLARYLSWRWRTQARKGNILHPNKISTLLESIGKSLDDRSPSRTRERFENALDTLVEDGVIVSWHYEKWDESIANHKGWSRIWLNSLVLIEPPDIILEQYHSIERKTKSSSLKKKNDNQLGKQIKRKRKSQQLSLSQLSEKLGISAPYISGIERGMKHPSFKLRTKILNWLENN
ncbi:helix-turn-helix domain-containing protein [Heyndrickxia vini]|uniref:Helix-turn-helix domain-containing protein n=1 Tax=Heyndrickxia vini TaxID=1476025 RepID=A0ABX7E3W1_9BACI|nr:helix-turn-helix domain-containing protein [Heyndrickxia vini]QQZ10157.1 helix-turn-helix domain-containing protein [Heyndrickxia vini]